MSDNAPHAAALMRQIAEAKFRRFPQARIAEALGHADQSLVGKWWKSKQRIGDESRDQLVAAFPEFTAEIDKAIAADRAHARRSRRARKAAPAVASRTEVAATGLEERELLDLFAVLTPEHRRDLIAAARAWATLDRGRFADAG